MCYTAIVHLISDFGKCLFVIHEQFFYPLNFVRYNEVFYRCTLNFRKGIRQIGVVILEFLRYIFRIVGFGKMVFIMDHLNYGDHYLFDENTFLILQ